MPTPGLAAELVYGGIDLIRADHGAIRAVLGLETFISAIDECATALRKVKLFSIMRNAVAFFCVAVSQSSLRQFDESYPRLSHWRKLLIINDV